MLPDFRSILFGAFLFYTNMIIHFNTLHPKEDGASIKGALMSKERIRIELHQDMDESHILIKEGSYYKHPTIEEIDFLINMLNKYKDNYDYLGLCVEGLNNCIIEEFDNDYFLYKRNREDKPKDRKKKTGYVYIAKCKKTLTYKIGCTTRDDPSKRILELKNTNPFIEEIAHFFVEDVLEEKRVGTRYLRKKI